MKLKFIVKEFFTEFLDNFRLPEIEITARRTKNKIIHIFQKVLLGYSYRDGWDISYSFKKKTIPLMRQYRKSFKEIPAIPTRLYKDYEKEIIEKFGKVDYDSKEITDFLLDKWKEIIKLVMWSINNINEDFIEQSEYPNPNYDPNSKLFEIVEVHKKTNLYRLNAETGYKFLFDSEKIIKLEKKKQMGLELFGKYLTSFWT